MKITDLKVAIIGDNPVDRIVTDADLCGYGAAESFKPYLKPHILYYKPFLLGQDPRDVERVMLCIRHRGALKPWGSAVSYRTTVHRLLGGKVRDQVRTYNGAVRFPMNGYSPEDYAETCRA